MKVSVDTDYLSSTLKRLLAIPSPGGMTQAILKAVEAELKDLGLDTEYTRRGGLKGHLQGRSGKQTRALAAHVDTLGAMVRELKDNGRLGIMPIGSWSSRVAEGCRVKIHTDSGTIFRGTIHPLKISAHAHSSEVDKQPVNWDQLEIRVDAPAQDKEALSALGLQVGDIVSIDPQTEILDNGYIVSRFLDDIGGVACLLAALKAMREQEIQAADDALLYFSHYEEMGHGASLNLPESVEELVAVDIAIVAPGQNSDESKLSLVFMDASGPFDPQLTRRLERLAKELELPHCRDVFRYYFSDCAAAIQAGNDIRHALLAFGTDASHAFERTHIDALEATAQLIVAYLSAE